MIESNSRSSSAICGSSRTGSCCRCSMSLSLSPRPLLSLMLRHRLLLPISPSSGSLIHQGPTDYRPCRLGRQPIGGPQPIAVASVALSGRSGHGNARTACPPASGRCRIERPGGRRGAGGNGEDMAKRSGARGGESRGQGLRVLMIAPTSFFADYGCHVRILEETLDLQRRGHRVTICTYPNGNAVPGLTIRRALGPPGVRRAVVGSSRHKLYLDASLSLRTVAAALAARPDLVHAHLHEGALIGGALARLLRRPLLFDYQGSLTAEMVDHGFLRQSGLLYGPTRLLERLANQAAGAIVTSTANAARLLREDSRIGPDRVMAVADGVDTRRFRPGVLTGAERAARRAAFGIGPERRVIVYLGLLAPHQGTGVLLEAARTVVARDPRAFFLLGGFPGNERYRLQAEELGLGAHTSFPGRIP